MTTKHTASHNGQTFKRNSKTREYSHVVLGRQSFDWAMARAESALHCDLDFDVFSHYAAYLDGTSEFLVRKPWDRDDARFEAKIARDIKHAREHLNGATTAEEYVDMMRERRVRAVIAAKENGEFERFGYLGWCSGLDLAKKLATSKRGGFYAEIVIIEVERA